MTSASPNRLKLRRMRVRGFKSLADFDLKTPSDLQLIIGGNGAGKSSILQALAFIRAIASGQAAAFFEDRGWSPSDARTKVKTTLRSNIITFRLHLEEEDGVRIYWYFWWNLIEKQIDLEEIWVQERDAEYAHRIINYHRDREIFISPSDDIDANYAIKGVRPDGSVVAFLSLEGRVQDFVAGLREWAAGIRSLELLSPTQMRQGARGSATDIGMRGERLSGFLASLSAERKASLISRLQVFYPLSGLETTRKRAGWIDLQIAEQYENFRSIGAAHMSDGFMRMLGLAAIPEFADAVSLVLLDEVEDGIDPHVLPAFIQLIARESRAQLIMTSHSPSLVNSFTPSQISFVARDGDGRSVSAPFDDLSVLKDELAYFGPGEIWANSDMKDINRLVLDAAIGQTGAKAASRREKEHDVIGFLEGE